jgi:hypothetical protein
MPHVRWMMTHDSHSRGALSLNHLPVDIGAN